MRKRFLIAWLAGLMIVSSGGLAGAVEIIWIHECDNAADPNSCALPDKRP